MTAELTLGTEVWTRKVYPAFVKGELVRQQCGSYRAVRWAPIGPLTVRRANQPWRCQGCGHRIAQGEPHGSDFYLHFCLDCVTTDEPPTHYEPA